MPHSSGSCAHPHRLWIILVLALTVAVVLPLAAGAGFDIASDQDAPSGEGQPDDIGHAPQPGFWQTVSHTVAEWGRWALGLFTRGGWGS